MLFYGIDNKVPYPMWGNQGHLNPNSIIYDIIYVNPQIASICCNKPVSARFEGLSGG